MFLSPIKCHKEDGRVSIEDQYSKLPIFQGMWAGKKEMGQEVGVSIDIYYIPTVLYHHEGVLHAF